MSAYPKHPEMQYLEIIDDIIKTGKFKNDRTGTGIYTKFGKQMRYDLKKGTDHSKAATRADSGIRASGRSVVHVEVGDAVIDPDHQQFIAHREHDRADE